MTTYKFKIQTYNLNDLTSSKYTPFATIESFEKGVVSTIVSALNQLAIKNDEGIRYVFLEDRIPA